MVTPLMLFLIMLAAFAAIVSLIDRHDIASGSGWAPWSEHHPLFADGPPFGRTTRLAQDRWAHRSLGEVPGDWRGRSAMHPGPAAEDCEANHGSTRVPERCAVPVTRFNPQLSYPIIGLLLGTGAPIGSFALRFISIAHVREHPFADLRANAFFYLYELVATSLIFAIAGFIAGWRADRLRRGEAFYQALAEHDSLTGLHNDRAFLDRYQRALERAAVTHQPLAIILIDVDHLKAINDALGHPAGSKALIHVAEALRRSKRAADIAARWGGDEFAILLESADAASAMRVAEGVLAHLRSTPLRLDHTSAPVTVTIGICTAGQPTASSDLFAAADRALFDGKNRGRNTIEIVSI